MMFLNKPISYIIALVVLVVAAFILITYTQAGKDLVSDFTDSQLEDLDPTGVETGGSNAILESRKNVVTFQNAWASSGNGICRIERMPEILGIREEGYSYNIILEEGKIKFDYDDPTQGFSFTEEISNVEKVYVIQDWQFALSEKGVSDLLSVLKEYRGAEKMAVMRTDVEFLGVDFIYEPEEFEILELYDENSLNANAKGAENLDMTYFWRSTFKVDKTLVFIEGDKFIGGGTKESTRIAEIEAIPLCGG